MYVDGTDGDKFGQMVELVISLVRWYSWSLIWVGCTVGDQFWGWYSW